MDAARPYMTDEKLEDYYAVLEARDSPNVVTLQHFVKTKDGWKVHVRR